MQKEFSYYIKIGELNQNVCKYVLRANSEQLEYLTNVLQVSQVKNFSSEIFLKLNLKANSLDVWGTVIADLVLNSVISLNDFDKHMEVPFELKYDTKATYEDIRELDNGIDSDVPDIIENGQINLVDIAIEQIALNLDDYPRADGEIFDESKYCTLETENKSNPFAVLEKLKK